MITKPWFRPKRWGWGYSPASWEGWAATGAVVIAVIAANRLIGSPAGLYVSAAFLGAFVVLAVATTRPR